MKEFDLIKTYFAKQLVKRKDVALGVGDDCAILSAPENKQIAITTDTLVAGTHFPEDTPARAIGHKAVAVSLSDLASMGAEPLWISLAISLPRVEQSWIEEFCEGLFELCEYYNVQLVGGDTTQGPLTITTTAQGSVNKDKFLTRSGASRGDWLYVTGNVGGAALALEQHYGRLTLSQEDKEAVFERLNHPSPRVLAGQIIKDYASAAIDISDGVLADLTHICNASSVGANIVLDDMPMHAAISHYLPQDKAYSLALNGGDDYELLFAVSESNKVAAETALSNANIPFSCIGQTNASGKITTTMNNKPVAIDIQGYQHFASNE
ncbi:thiamine-phosphate kinase [Thalassotalea agarivorans]|uniref:Thiamine-monophosphate kinase n=1 Tax=Thalassotalea agarivorans TaxID=349064 RepID=A0A1H9YHS0_THASX|nr:thiamine-phosphate kinase [Thalassotalea agarivorans]SES68470.1 thiamine-phosphate kinase [Thalassotalea agarivorans]